MVLIFNSMVSREISSVLGFVICQVFCLRCDYCSESKPVSTWTRHTVSFYSM